MGKTWLVKHLLGEARKRHDALDLALEFDVASRPSTTSQAYDSFVDVVISLGARLKERGDRESRLFVEFENEIDAAENARANLSLDVDIFADDATIEDSEVGVFDIDFGEGEGRVARRVALAFLKKFRLLAKRRCAVVTVDGFDAIAGTDLARWLLSLLVKLPNTLVVLTRSPGAAAPGLPGAPPDRRELEPFSRDDIEGLLAAYLGVPSVDGRLVDVVHEWSQGHPFTAGLAAKYMRDVRETDVDVFAARLAELPDDLTEQRIDLALQIVRAPGAGDLEDAARACAVARRFDAELLRALVEPEALPVSAEEAIERLLQAGLVESAGRRQYRVHAFIREPLEDGLDVARRRRLHRRAASYYYQLLCAEEPELGEGARAYDDWYRYEKPEWQAQLRDWLHHLRESAQTENERRRARLQFLRVFLDAFWWWGCYLDFPFCGDLIADWRSARGDDAEWVEDLQLFLDSYPTGYQKQDAAGWPDARAALIAVRDACGLDSDADDLKGPDARHTRGLVDNFLADSSHFRACATDADREKAYSQALVYHEEAARLFERNDETWELAWTLFEAAELHFDFGAPEEARATWRGAVALALDEDDWELNANLHRLRADLRWREGARADAFDAHGRAVLHAYLFQCKTDSRRPDPYTVAFYWEQVERAAKRLREVDGAALADAVARLAAPFGRAPDVDAVRPALAPGEPRRLAGLVLPDAPRSEELLQTRSPFTRAVDALAEDLGEPERDLAGLEP